MADPDKSISIFRQKSPSSSSTTSPTKIKFAPPRQHSSPPRHHLPPPQLLNTLPAKQPHVSDIQTKVKQVKPFPQVQAHLMLRMMMKPCWSPSALLVEFYISYISPKSYLPATKCQWWSIGPPAAIPGVAGHHHHHQHEEDWPVGISELSHALLPRVAVFTVPTVP